MPPNYVKAYVKRNKHDVADAEAICEAVRRPSMRFVPLKTTEQQSALMMHRARDLLIRQRTMLVNALRGHLAEFGLIEAQGLHKVARLVTIVVDEVDERVPEMARQVLKVIVNQLKDIQTEMPTSKSRFSCGTRTIQSANVSPPFQASGRSSPRRSPRRSQIRIHSAVAESLPPGSGWCHDRTLPVAKRASVELANEEIVISAVCSSTAHTRFCCARRRPRTIPG